MPLFSAKTLEEKLKPAEELQAKEKSLKSSAGYMSPEEIEMVQMKHEAKLEDAKVVSQLIKALKVQCNAAEIQKLKASLKHLSFLLGHFEESLEDWTLGRAIGFYLFMINSKT